MRRILFLLVLLFAGSGCAALIYEVVWFQLLELVIGSSAVSMGVLLGTFMGGMCLGSFLLPRFVPSDAHPLRVYAWLELGIGVMRLLILFGMPFGAVAPESARVSGDRVVFPVVALWGPTSPWGEVIWTRVLSLLLGATVSMFALFLAVCLPGLGLGSGAGSEIWRTPERSRLALAWC